MEIKKKLDSLLDNILHIFFSSDKTRLYVLLIFLLGLALRLINVMNFPTSVDASGHAIMAINFIDSGKLATWNQSVGLWHYLTDLAYKLFGINDFSSRFVALLFGSFSIILMFLFVKEIFGRRAGLISSFLLAISPFHITETVPEMDVAVMFFVLFSCYFFIKGLKSSQSSRFIYSGIMLGLAILIKVYALLFIPVLLVYGLYPMHIQNKKNPKKNLALFLIFTALFCIVPLVYNFLLYKDKGYVDFLFTGMTGIGKEKSDQYYSWVVPYKHDYLNFFIPGSSSGLPFFIYYLKNIGTIDLLSVILGLAGIALMFKKKDKSYLFLSLLIFLFVYLYLGSIVFLMIKHYMFLLIFLIPFGAFFLDRISSRIKIRMRYLLPLLLIFQLFWLMQHTPDFFVKSPMNQLVSYKSSIPENSLVIYDTRIFRGIGSYIFSGRHYLESSYMPALFSMQENMTGPVVSLKVYFIECSTDDCGWGTIKDQPDINLSAEQVVDFFKNNSQVVKTISSHNQENYRIYKATFNMRQASLSAADSTHIFWANPIGYNQKIAPVFDSYEASSTIDQLIDSIAHWILFAAAVLAILSIFCILYFFIIENEAQHNNPSV